MNNDAEADAIAFALIASVTIGAAIIVAKLIKYALREREHDAKAQELFNLKTGLHPADDVYGGESWDDWPELEQYLEQRPGLREQYEREAMSHRGKGARK